MSACWLNRLGNRAWKAHPNQLPFLMFLSRRLHWQIKQAWLWLCLSIEIPSYSSLVISNGKCFNWTQLRIHFNCLSAFVQNDFESKMLLTKLIKCSCFPQNRMWRTPSHLGRTNSKLLFALFVDNVCCLNIIQYLKSTVLMHVQNIKFLLYEVDRKCLCDVICLWSAEVPLGSLIC